MYEELIAALQDRIASGQNKVSLKSEVVSAGYTPEEFEAHYAAAKVRANTAATQPVRSSTAPVSEPAAAPTVTAAHYSEHTRSSESSADLDVASGVTPTAVSYPALSQEAPSSANRYTHKLVLAVLTILLVLAGAAAAFMSGVFSFRFPTAVTSSPLREERLLSDIISAIQASERGTYTNSVRITTNARDADVRTFPSSDSGMSSLYGAVLDDAYAAADLAIPSDLDMTFEVAGTFDTTLDLEDISSLAQQTRVLFSYAANDFETAAEVEFFISGTEGIFMRMTKFPLPLFDFGKIEGTWIQIYDESLADQFAEIPDIQRDLVMAAVESEFERAIELADSYQVFTIADGPRRDQVGDYTAYRYQLALNPDTVRDFLEAYQSGAEATISQEARESFDALSQLGSAFLAQRSPVELQQIPDFDNSIEYPVYDYEDPFADVLDFYTSPEFVSYLNAQWPITIWVTGEGELVKVLLGGRLVFTDDPDQALYNKQFNFDFTTEMAEVNTSRTPESPDEYLTPSELMRSVPGLEAFFMGSGDPFGAIDPFGYEDARRKEQDASIKQSITSIRAQAEIHYAEAVSYQGVCQNSQVSSLLSAAAAYSRPDCAATDDSYVVEAELSGSYFCVDVTGFAGESYLSMFDDEAYVCDTDRYVNY